MTAVRSFTERAGATEPRQPATISDCVLAKTSVETFATRLNVAVMSPHLRRVLEVTDGYANWHTSQIGRAPATMLLHRRPDRETARSGGVIRCKTTAPLGDRARSCFFGTIDHLVRSPPVRQQRSYQWSNHHSDATARSPGKSLKEKREAKKSKQQDKKPIGN